VLDEPSGEQADGGEGVELALAAAAGRLDLRLGAIEAADAVCRKEYDYPKRLSFPTGALILEEEERRFGKNPWQHGLAPNAHTLEKFMQYAAAQGYTPRVLSIDESFWPGIQASSASERSSRRLVAAS
jgi:hypothetical protein